MEHQWAGGRKGGRADLTNAEPGETGPLGLELALCSAGRRAASCGGVSWVWPIACVAAMLYGSLLPLNISWDAFHLSNWFGLTGIGWHRATTADLVTNVLVYVPIGVSLMLSRVGLGLGAFGMLVVVLIGGQVSVLAEAVQTGIPERVASWTDVALNTFGVFVGAVCAAIGYAVAPSAVAVVHRRWRRSPVEFVVIVLTLATMVYCLLPFDFVTTTPALHAAFQRAQCGLGSLLEGIVGGSMEHMVSNLRAAAWFALLGYLSVYAQRHAGRKVEEALGEAVHHVVLLAVLIEVLQGLTNSHVFSAGSLVLRAAGAVGGAWYASFLSEGSWIVDGAVRWERLFPPRLVAGAVVFQVLMIALGSLTAGDMHAVGVAARLHWPPFEGLWRLAAGQAVSELAATAFVYGVLAATVGGLLTLRRSHRPWVAATLAVAVVALLSEGLRYLSGHGADPATVLLALAASLVVAWVVRTMASSRYTPIRTGGPAMEVTSGA